MHVRRYAGHGGKEFARCCVHGLQEQDRFTSKEAQQCCPVAKADIVFGGASCKYFSNISVNKKHGSSSEMLGNAAASDQNSCYVILKRFLRYLEEHRPAIFVWETVDGIASSKAEEVIHNSCLALLNSTCTPLGYVIQTILTESSRCFIPQSRRRIYIIGAFKQSDSSHLDNAGGKHKACAA